jgi:elongator complex protein 3
VRAGRYQEWFLARAFDALNAFPPNDDSAGLPPPFGADERILEHERGAVPAERGPRTTTPPSAPGEFDLAGAQERNEIASARMIGLTIETKPDWCKKPHLETMLRLGTTRVEIGIQTVHEDQLLRTRRGHTAGDSIEATALAKDAGLKVCYHIMPGLPGSSMAKDMETFRTVLRDAAWSPDMLKIYPVLVVPGTELWDAWSRGEYKPADEAYCVDLLAEAKRIVPPWVRIQRIDRDIPTTLVSAGVKKSNLRELVHAEMRRRGTRCRCVRCRETGRVPGKVEELRFSEISYPASGGVEHFLSWEDPARDALVAFARVREPSADGWRPEGEDAVFLRELRVLGREVALAAAPSQAETQHRGLGRALLSKTEELARTLGRGKVTVTAGVGVREYYRRHGYERDGPYMSKKAQGVG